MVVSAGKKANLQRVAMLSSLKETSMHASATYDSALRSGTIHSCNDCMVLLVLLAFLSKGLYWS